MTQKKYVDMRNEELPKLSEIIEPTVLWSNDKNHFHSCMKSLFGSRLLNKIQRSLKEGFVYLNIHVSLLMHACMRKYRDEYGRGHFHVMEIHPLQDKPNHPAKPSGELTHKSENTTTPPPVQPSNQPKPKETSLGFGIYFNGTLVEQVGGEASGKATPASVGKLIKKAFNNNLPDYVVTTSASGNSVEVTLSSKTTGMMTNFTVEVAAQAKTSALVEQNTQGVNAVIVKEQFTDNNNQGYLYIHTADDAAAEKLREKGTETNPSIHNDPAPSTKAVGLVMYFGDSNGAMFEHINETNLKDQLVTDLMSAYPDYHFDAWLNDEHSFGFRVRDTTTNSIESINLDIQSTLVHRIFIRTEENKVKIYVKSDNTGFADYVHIHLYNDSHPSMINTLTGASDKVADPEARENLDKSIEIISASGSGGTTNVRTRFVNLPTVTSTSLALLAVGVSDYGSKGTTFAYSGEYTLTSEGMDVEIFHGPGHGFKIVDNKWVSTEGITAQFTGNLYVFDRAMLDDGSIAEFPPGSIIQSNELDPYIAKNMSSLSLDELDNVPGLISTLKLVNSEPAPTES